MLTNWQQILPGIIENLSPLQRNIVMYLLTLQGKRKPAYSYAERTWNLGRDEFDNELAYTFRTIRQHLKQYGIASSSDLEFV